LKRVNPRREKVLGFVRNSFVAKKILGYKVYLTRINYPSKFCRRELDGLLGQPLNETGSQGSL